MTKQCNWSENKWKDNGSYVVLTCDNTNTERDKDNVNERWFCIDKDNHMQEVIKTRKIMHKNCINKEKLTKFILSNSYQSAYALPEPEHLVWDISPRHLINALESGEFDNE